jgi:phosphohistidine phosphatase SixA
VGDFENSEVTITFNTNMPMDEASTIANARNSVGLISNRTIVAHHPWVTDLEGELNQLEAERQESIEQSLSGYDPFGTMNAKNGEEDGDA